MNTLTVELVVCNYIIHILNGQRISFDIIFITSYWFEQCIKLGEIG